MWDALAIQPQYLIYKHTKYDSHEEIQISRELLNYESWYFLQSVVWTILCHTLPNKHWQKYKILYLFISRDHAFKQKVEKVDLFVFISQLHLADINFVVGDWHHYEVWYSKIIS